MSDEPSVPFRPGEFIAGKYRVERILGAGGMGVVVEATHIDLERKVAVKLIRAELAEEPSTVERLMLEAKAAARIKSEHVGKVLDVGKLPSGAPYIVMEYLEGHDLCHLLETRGSLKITQAVDYVMQACEALAEAHAANIVHRDLKPENLFVARQPDGSVTIKVLDFGISKRLDAGDRRQLTNPSTAVGSPRYMAPEQMQGGAIDVRADIWSLGAILYECLSNIPAFDSDTLPGICAQVLSQNPRSLRDLAPQTPDRLAAIIARCLEKQREKRFNNVAELADALAPYGTERSDLSRRRISALLGGSPAVDSTQMIEPAHLIDAQGRTAVVDTGQVVAAVTTGTTLGRGVSLDLASGAEASTAQAKKRAVWPFVVVPLLGVAIAAVAVIFVTGADEVASAEPEDSALAAAPVVPSDDGEREARPKDDGVPVETEPESVEAEPSAEPEITAPLEITEPEIAEPETTKPTATRAAARAPKPPPQKRAKKPPPKEPQESKQDDSAKKPTDAWDPNNFGGRE